MAWHNLFSNFLQNYIVFRTIFRLIIKQTKRS